MNIAIASKRRRLCPRQLLPTGSIAGLFTSWNLPQRAVPQASKVRMKQNRMLVSILAIGLAGVFGHLVHADGDPRIPLLSYTA